MYNLHQNSRTKKARLSLSLNVKLNLSRENSQHSRSQPAKVLLYHNQLHGFVLFPLWPQVNCMNYTVADWDKFHFLVTFADVVHT